MVFHGRSAAGGEMALHRAGKHCGCRMLLHHRHCWLLVLKGLQVVNVCGVKSTIKAAVSWLLFLETGMEGLQGRRDWGWPGHRAGGAVGGQAG